MLWRIGGKQVELGIFDAQRAMEECERRVRFEGTQPTVELLATVASYVQRRFSLDCSLTTAWTFWWAVCEVCDRLRKRSERIAEIGHWLHVDGTRLSDTQLFGLAANLPRIKAQNKVNAGQFDPTDYQGVYRLVLQATGDEQQARKAQADAAERFVDSRIGG